MVVDTSRAESILLIRLGGLGDVVFTLPAVLALKSAFPKARISYLIYKEFAPLLATFPNIDEVIELDRDQYRGFHPRTIVTSVVSLLARLRRGRFDLVVDFQGFGETGLLSWWTGAPQRWGSVYRPTRAWAYMRGIRRNLALHPIEAQLDLLKQAGGISPQIVRNDLTLPAKAVDEARRFFSEQNLNEREPILFVQPFSKVEQKNWPLSSYLALARELKNDGMQVLFGGGPSEIAALAPARGAGFAVAAGVPLLTSAGLVSLSTVVLGNDTGLLHLAVALGRRVVMIIDSIGPGKCFPFGHADWTVLPEVGTPIASVPPEVVCEACRRALSGVRSMPCTPVGQTRG